MSPSTLVRTAAAPLLALSFLAAPALADAPEITRLAPERSFLVASIANWTQFEERFEASGLGRLWNDPSVQRFVEHVTEEPIKELKERLAAAQLDMEDLKLPRGTVGLALFMPRADNDEPERDPWDRPEREPHFVAVIDMGDRADDIQATIDRVVERAFDDRLITLDDDTYRDVKITIISHVREEVDEEAPAWRRPQTPAWQRRNLHLARIDSAFVVTDELAAAELAIDGFRGDARDTVADSAAFRDSRAQLPDDVLGYGVFLLAPMIDEFRTEVEAEVPGLLGLLGIEQLKAISAGLRLDTAAAVVDMPFAVLVPEKAGLISLLDHSATGFEPPAYIPADAASASRMAFRFDRVVELVRDAMARFPAEMRAEMEMYVEQGLGVVEPAFEVMGPSIHTFTSYRQPLSPDSELMTFAIELRDEVPVSNTLAFIVSVSGGMLEPRDFEGGQIYTADLMGMLEMAVGIGAGQLFIGSAAGIENAMRLAAQPDAPALAAEPAFREATRALSPDAVMYSWADLGQSLRWQYWTLQNPDKVLEQQMEGWGWLDAEQREEMLRRERDEMGEWRKKLPPVELILEHIGDNVTDLRSTPDGFRGQMLLLHPRRE